MPRVLTETQREAARQRAAAYRKKFPEKVKLAKRASIAKSPEKYAQASRDWATSNPEKRKAALRKSYAKHRETALARVKLDRARRPAEYKARSQKYYATNRDAVLSKGRAWKVKNRERIAQRNRDYYLEKKDTILKKQRTYASANPKKASARSKKWKANNPEKHAWSAYRAGAKSRGLVWFLTFDQFCALRTAPCHFHGIVTAGGGGIDRLDSDLGYLPENCVPCCAVCNQMKMDLKLDVFLARCRAIAVRFPAPSSETPEALAAPPESVATPALP